MHLVDRAGRLMARVVVPGLAGQGLPPTDTDLCSQVEDDAVPLQGAGRLVVTDTAEGVLSGPEKKFSRPVTSA